MADFLRKHRAEVVNVCIKEFNQEVYEKGIREEGYEEGFEDGIKSAVRMLQKMKLSRVEIEQKILEEYTISEEMLGQILDELLPV